MTTIGNVKRKVTTNYFQYIVMVFTGLVLVWMYLAVVIVFRNPKHALRREEFSLDSPPLVLLSSPARKIELWNEQNIVTTCTVRTDVRGNLAPAEVLLSNRTADWIHDRWQAASDMHGTQIRGQHWVLLEWSRPVQIHAMALDWEAAFSDHYDVQVLPAGYKENGSNENDEEDAWSTIFHASRDRFQVTKSGQSPGVKTKTPLHVLHEFNLTTTPTTQSLRIVIRKSNTGWGVSLWQVRVYGLDVNEERIAVA